MRRMAGLGLPQGVLPPHQRPDIDLLRSLGFTGTDARVWERAWREEPAIARAALDASAMWVANAATVSPSADCEDGRLHVSVANLQTMLHRSLEPEQTERTLRKLLPDKTRFTVHPALPPHDSVSDEGAANHMRLSGGATGVEVFVYGRTAEEDEHRAGFPARQSLEASRALARRHALDPGRTMYARQSPAAINAGCFHNDVVAVAHDDVLLHHEHAFADEKAVYAELREKSRGLFEPVFVRVPASRVSLENAVSTYLFNSQLVREPGARSLTLIAPVEVGRHPDTSAFIRQIMDQPAPPIGRVEYVDVRESMRGGGGPACLRLRIAMTEEERDAAEHGFFLTDSLAERLETWVRKHYREELAPEDLGDPDLIEETRAALDELSRILPLGSDYYPFQRA
jgi:succinylarginine dihydrolase